MLRFGVIMIIPLYISLYTVLFGRWVRQKDQQANPIPAYVLGLSGFGMTGFIFWRMFL